MKSVILDVDTGHDDAVALLMAAQSPQIHVMAVTVVHGNAPLPVTLCNTLRVMAAGGFPDVPVLAGMDRPLTRSLVRTSGRQAAELDLPETAHQAESEHAVDFLVRTLMSVGEPITLVPLAPLTNIAMALLREPHIARGIERMVMMGGAVSGGNTNAVAEFNIYADPESARVVFNAGIPITMVGLDVTRQALVRPDDVERVRALTSTAARTATPIIDEMVDIVIHRWGRPGAQIYDACAVAAVIEPDLLTTQPMYVDVETCGELTLGQTVCDVRNRLKREPNVDVGLGIDRERFLDVLVKSLG